MIKNYKNFHIDNLFESINESVLYLSPDFRKILKSVNSEISRDLLNHWGTDIKPDLTFIDMDAEPGYITFGPMANFLKKNTNGQLSHVQDRVDKDIVDRVWEVDRDSTADGSQSSRYGMYRDKSRNTVKLGRLVNKIFPKKYADKDVEQFVNDFKASIEKVGEHFHVVEGKDIMKWYKGDTYKVRAGSLGGSCMKNSPSDFFKIFAENPESCRMVILVEDGRLLGRALLWKITEALDINNGDTPVEMGYFMDRQYTTNDADIVKFRNYALKNKWAYKERNHHSSMDGVIMADGRAKKLKLKIQLKAVDYGEYPYMDTFKRYNPKTGSLENSKDCIDDYYVMESTEGNFVRCGGKYSDYYDQYIDPDDAYRSQYLNDWIKISDSVEIALGRYAGTRLPRGYRRVKQDPYRRVYLMEEDCVYSEYYGNYIFRDDSKRAITDFRPDYRIRTTGIMSVNDGDNFYPLAAIAEEPWFKAAVDKFRWNALNGQRIDGIKRRLLTQTTEGIMVPSILSVRLYKSNKPEKIEYLSEVDSHILNIQIDKNQSIITDVVTYNVDLKARALTRTLTVRINKLKARIAAEEEEIRTNSMNDGSYDPDRDQMDRFAPDQDEYGNYNRNFDRDGRAIPGRRVQTVKLSPMDKEASKRGDSMFWGNYSNLFDVSR